MNIRKPIDYSTLFTALDVLMTAALPQMKLYCGIGHLVSSRPEKGAAVAAAEYLQGTYPGTTGFSPRNLRRMRDFYRTYERIPEVMAEAMSIGWTQNVVILEAELMPQEKAWYIRAVQQFGWSKLELMKQIMSASHLEILLDLPEEVCISKKSNSSVSENDDEKPAYLQRESLPQPNGRVYNEGPGKKGWAGSSISHRVRRHQHGGNWQPGLSSGEAQAVRAWHRLRWEAGTAVHQLRLRQIRPPNRDGPDCHVLEHYNFAVEPKPEPALQLHHPYWGRSHFSKAGIVSGRP